MHNVVKELFPGSSVKGYQFHIVQAIWRKIQGLGLSKIYSERESGTEMAFSHIGPCIFGTTGSMPDIMSDTSSEINAC